MSKNVYIIVLKEFELHLVVFFNPLPRLINNEKMRILLYSHFCNREISGNLNKDSLGIVSTFYLHTIKKLRTLLF